nr:hypothetical protein [Tanacetum cinerariifolium]
MPTAPAPPSPINAPSSAPQDLIPIPHATPLQDQPSTPPASPPQEQPTTTYESSMSLLTTLMETYASLSQKVAELEQDKHTQALKIIKLEKREDASKQKGNIEAIDANEDITLVDVEKDEETLIKMKAEKAKLLDEQMTQKLHDEEVLKAAAMDKQEKDDMERAQNMVGYKMEHFKGMTYHKARPIFEREYKNVQTLFKPDKDVEEPKKKRVADETPLQESFKKLKAVKVSGSESTQEIPSNDPKEMSKEDVHNMLEIIPVSEFKVEALQVKYPIID